MAHFSVVIDGDPLRREQYLAAAKARLPANDDLRMSIETTASVSTIWQTSNRAPVSFCSDAGSFALLLGQAHAGASPKPLDARGLLALWKATDEGGAPPAFDGFYAGVVFTSAEGLVVGSDLLGLFPVYYASAGDVAIVSSSPALIGLHPLFPAAVDPNGLVGILLMGCLVGQQTLVKGVHRLGQGRALRCASGSAPYEVTQYTLFAEAPEPTAPAEQLARLDSALSNALHRLAPPGSPHGLLLSGGRDARLLAGYLARNGTPMQALTLGQAGDYEADCACAIARELRIPHSVVSLDADKFVEGAERQASLEFLGTGFNNVSLWSANTLMCGLPQAWVGGHVFDAVITGATASARDADVERVLPILNRFGIEPEQLRALFQDAEFRDAVGNGIDQIRLAYEGSSSIPELRPWRFQLETSARFYAGGSYPWRLSFGSWPVLPVLDRGVLDAVTRLPITARLRRTAEDALLREKFPELARLPVVTRNAELGLPLLPSRGDRLRHRLTRIRRRLPSLRRGIERRYTYRLYDFNGPEWRAIRRTAEPFRERLEPWFNMDTLRQFLPSPDVHVPFADGVIDAHGRKLLLGLMLWSSRQLA